MKGIRLSHGLIVVYYGGSSFKIRPNGEVSISNIDYHVLEWDLRTERPDSYEYIDEYDIKSLGGGIYEKIIEEKEKIDRILGIKK